MNEGQVAQKIVHHMHADHGMNVIPADFMIKIKYSINNQNITDTVNLAAKKMLVK
jgi:predicted small metal-binding protein